MEEVIGLPILIGFFLISAVMGVAISRSNFCTMGAVSDWVNLRDFGRLGAWLLATVVAMMFIAILEFGAVVDVDGSRPPYRSATFAWLRYLLGGLIFGIGMTLAGGCASKNLVRLGGGNLKSLVTLIVVAIFAYLMTKTIFFEVAFYNWMNPSAVQLDELGIESQDLGAIVNSVVSFADASIVRIGLAIVLFILVLRFILRTNGIRNNAANVVSGCVIGCCISLAWYLTASSIGANWVEAAEWADNPPVGVGPQSFTFINPLGEYISWILDFSNASVLLTVGMCAAFGLFAGSLADSMIRREFHLVWFVSLKDFAANAIGGMLMGIGGVLALGCTIGQGISGVSTLALGSFMAVAAIIFGSAITLKVQYYKLLYEEAGVIDALVSSFVDMKLLPESLRKLESF